MKGRSPTLNSTVHSNGGRACHTPRWPSLLPVKTAMQIRISEKKPRNLSLRILQNAPSTQPGYKNSEKKSSVLEEPPSSIDTNLNFVRMPSLPACSGKAAHRYRPLSIICNPSPEPQSGTTS